MVVRVDHHGAHLPPPSEELFKRMAYAGMREMKPFHELNEFIRISPVEVEGHWRSVARAMYAVVAARGGAKLTPAPGGKECPPSTSR